MSIIPNEEAVQKREARPGIVIAFDDQWFGAPWMDGEPIVLFLNGIRRFVNE
jgi:hypothetical protein